MVTEVLNLDETIKKFDKMGKVDVKPYIQEATQKVQRTAKKKCRKDTGHLARNIYRKTERIGNTVIGSVYNPVEYAPYIEFGVADSVTIRPVKAKALHWKDKKTKEDIFAKKVVIPPRKAQPFMKPALDYHKEEIKKGLEDYIGKELLKAIK
jgi:HK97 gp10 family phage protein